MPENSGRRTSRLTRVVARVVAAACLAASGSGNGLSAQSVRSPGDGVYTAEQAARGEALYGEHCASCHGVELEGVERAPALAGDDFGFNWDGATLGELFEQMSVSMPQNDPGRLSPEQNADILAYMLHKGNYPPGDTELPTDLEVLNPLTLSATRP